MHIIRRRLLTSHYLEPTAKKKVIGKRVEVFHALGYGQPEDAIYFLVLRPLLSMTTLQLDAKGCAHGACVMIQVHAKLDARHVLGDHLVCISLDGTFHELMLRHARAIHPRELRDVLSRMAVRRMPVYRRNDISASSLEAQRLVDRIIGDD